MAEETGTVGKSPDWEAVRAEYEGREFLPSLICRRHGITLSQLRYRRECEGWFSARARPPRRDDLVARMLKVLDRQIRQLETAVSEPIDKQTNILATQVKTLDKLIEMGVVADGVVGPLTLAAAGTADGARAINDLCDRRLGFLGRLSTFSTFGRGWTRRVAAIRKAALEMAPAAALPSLLQRRTIMDVLTGYKTYIVAAFMLLAGLAQLLGVELPALEGSAAGNLMLEALAIIFLRKGLKGDIGRA